MAEVRIVDLDPTISLLRTCVTINEDVDNAESFHLEYGVLNDLIKGSLTGVENIITRFDSSTNTITIKAGTIFNLVKDGKTYGIVEDADVELVIGPAGLPEAEGTFYIYCSESFDNTLLNTRGVYIANDEPGIYDGEKGGYYSEYGKCIGIYTLLFFNDNYIVTKLFIYSGNIILCYSNQEISALNMNTHISPAFTGQVLINTSYPLLMFGYDNAGSLEWYGYNNFRTLTIGDINNYTEFESNGFPVQKGTAIAYRDEYVAGEWVPSAAAAAPDAENYTIAGVAIRKLSFNGSATAESMSNCFEIPHDYALGEDIELHIHYRPSTTGAGDIKWNFTWEHSKANKSDSPINAPDGQTAISVVDTITADTQYYHYVASFGNLPDLGYGIGDIISFSISRDPSDEDDTYEADAILEKVALHVPIDTMGSRQVYVK